MTERVRRLVCRWIGHRWQLDGRAAPVIVAFAVCARCGKWSRVAR